MEAKERKIFVPFLAAGLLAMMVSVYAYLRPSGLVYAFYRLTDQFWAQCGFSLGLICLGIAFTLLCRRSIRHGKKGIIAAALAALSVVGAGAVLWNLYNDDINKYLMHEYVTADGQHSVFGLTYYDVMGQRGRRYYVHAGKYSYTYIENVSLEWNDPSDSDAYINVENDGVYALPENSMIYQWKD